MPRPNSVRYWELFEAHSILPYPGSWVNQPAWVVNDFECLWLLQEFHELDTQMADKSKLPPLEGLVKGGS